MDQAETTQPPPPPLRGRDEIYRNILVIARKRAFDAQLEGRKQLQAVETAHLQSIPGLIGCLDERRHGYYLEQAVPKFMRHFRKPDDIAIFDWLWAELRAHLVAKNGGLLPANPVVLNYERDKK